jgi:hypothetical protein
VFPNGKAEFIDNKDRRRSKSATAIVQETHPSAYSREISVGDVEDGTPSATPTARRGSW